MATELMKYSCESKWDKKALDWVDSKVINPVRLGNNWYEVSDDLTGLDAVKGVNVWLDGKKDPAWLKVAKIVPRLIRTVVILAYHPIKFTAYFILHPCKAVIRLTKFACDILTALATKPELWTNVGAGFIGAGLGNSFVTGGMSLLMSMLGAGMIAIGLVFGAVKSACSAEAGHKWEAVWEMFLEQMKELPEAFLTGLTLGALFGGIAKVQKMDASINNVMGAADDLPVIAAGVHG